MSKRKMKYLIISLLALSLLVVVAVAVVNSLSLRRSQASIKDSILQLTPIGMDMENVIAVIESKRKWKVEYISYEHGFTRPGRPDPNDIASGWGSVVGEKSIRVFLGDYRNIFITSVSVFWGFDADSKLIDVHVWKDKDVL